jgi:hypothetical protein
MAQLMGLPARANGSYASRTGSGGSTVDVGNAPAMFDAAMKEAGLNAVSVQGHGQVIADAVNKKYPGLGVTVDPHTDAILWPGIGSVDVTIDSGKGGFYFRPDGYQGPSAAGTSTRSYAATVPSAVQPPTPAPAPVTSALPTPPPARNADLAAPSASRITVVAPNGQRKQVPASEADHWRSRGGTILEGAA